MWIRLLSNINLNSVFEIFKMWSFHKKDNVTLTIKSTFCVLIPSLFFALPLIRPWPARDINSFLKNIKTVPLRFPYDKPIGKLTKDFIMHCLTINEDLRMNWEEVGNQ